MKRYLGFLFILVILFCFSGKAQDAQFASQLTELIRLYGSGQMNKAVIHADSVLDKFKNQKNKQDTIYPYILYYSAIVNGFAGNWDKCAKVLPDLEDVCLKRYGKNDIKYWSALDFQRQLAGIKNDWAKRIRYQIKAMDILLNIYAVIDSGEVKSFDLTYKRKDIQFYIQSSYFGLGISYANINDHKKAMEAYKQSEKYLDEEYTITLDPQSFLYYKSTYGSYLLMIEELEQSEKAFTDLETWVRKSFTNSHPVYGEMLYRLGNFYYSIGQLAKSEKYLLEAKKIFDNTFQKNTSPYYFTILRLCDIYNAGYHAERMDVFVNELKKVAAKTDSSWRVTFVLSKIYLLEHYEKENQERLVDSVVRTLDDFFKNKDYTYSYTYNNYLAVKTEQYEKANQFSLADSLYRLRIRFHQNTGGNNSKAYANILLKRSINFFNWGKTNEAIEELKKSIEAVTSNLAKTFSFLSEAEKQTYITTTRSIFNQLNAIAFKQNSPGLVKLAYDCQLILKELLLKTSVLANKPVAGKDSIYTKQYSAYAELRKKLNYYASLPQAEKNDYEELVKDAEKMEKKLAKSSAGFIKNQFRPIQVEELQNSLAPGEAAIEFTHFQKGDSTYYIALVAKKGNGIPILVPLFEKNQLDSFFSYTSLGQQHEVINLRYAHNNTLYKLIWQPIESHLRDVSKIYFSLSGDLFRIPVTILPVNDSSKICDRYQLTHLSSTSSIAKTANYSIEPNDALYLYGGIFYDGDSTELINAAARYNLNGYATRSLPESIMRGEFWQYLPNTKTEVETVYESAKANRLNANLFVGWEASEESVKSLHGENSPTVLHFATHGFFFPDPLKRKSKYKYTIGTAFTNNDDPLMRSGICLAGANYAWDNKPLKGIQDGVLTSYEISNLDLSNTKLVVLSACETGLGDIIEHEGVFGLQRAFKIAGVKNLVMSLWSVPDNVTADFMIEFYRGLFEHKNIEEAFQQTQTIFRKKYPNEPFKWGAWVLIK